ncbi:MAG: hypothetical protein KatS3mg102_1507 [Planctomycetota bacterium]|nr:MAG: hypothetical protein KatS3mg102_1507 [Planctomycetota bacterium]
MPRAGARVPLAEGLLGGEGVFETVRVVRGRAVRLPAHLARLQAGARALGLLGGLPAAPQAALAPLLARWGAQDGVLRLVLVAAGSGGQDTAGRAEAAGAGAACFWALLEPPRPLPPGAREHGVALVLGPPGLAATGPAAGLKTLSRLGWRLARRQAHRRGAFDAILLDHAGRVCETTVANLFWAAGGTLYTPALELGVLPGTVRAEVLAAAARLGIAVREGAFTSGVLERAEEAFLTNALVGVLPVARIGERALPRIGRAARAPAGQRAAGAGGGGTRRRHEACVHLRHPWQPGGAGGGPGGHRPAGGGPDRLPRRHRRLWCQSVRDGGGGLLRGGGHGARQPRAHGLPQAHRRRDGEPAGGDRGTLDARAHAAARAARPGGQPLRPQARDLALAGPPQAHPSLALHAVRPRDARLGGGLHPQPRGCARGLRAPDGRCAAVVRRPHPRAGDLPLRQGGGASPGCRGKRARRIAWDGGP